MWPPNQAWLQTLDQSLLLYPLRSMATPIDPLPRPMQPSPPFRL